MAESGTKHFFVTNRLVNPVLVRVLTSRAGGLLGRRLAVVSYHGHRTGRARALVVRYRREGSTVRIEVGMPERKRWWRGFETAQPMRLRLAGRDYLARAQVERDGPAVHVVAKIQVPVVGQVEQFGLRL